MYDHNQKAGNPGDVIKHTALIAAASVLMDSCKGTFHYADTYAGYAYNPLKLRGEWKDGIGIWHDSGLSSQNLAIRFWKDLWECKAGLRGSVYPGSSLFMLKLCMEKQLSFQARLWDISPTVISQLVTFYDHDEVEIFPRPATNADFDSYKPDLLLVDPPDLNDVSKVLPLFEIVDNVILWLPITTIDGIETEASCNAYQKCKARGLSIISVCWDTKKNTRGCRLIYQLQEDAGNALSNAVNDSVNLLEWEFD